jgi:(p)ppGpp synthase/HD superfamily hydrolase
MHPEERAMNRPLILPPLHRTASDACLFAKFVHEGQVDKAGNPYTDHLFRVAGRVYALSDGCPFWDHEDRDEAAQIAWLHDTIEDTWVATGTLLREGFSPRVIDAVSLLTKPDVPVSYQTWIERLIDLADLPTILVKLADVEDNSDPERLTLLPAETQERLFRKYEPAKEVLRASARQKGWQG